MKKYKPLIEDSLWNTFGLELKLENQTARYVTYGLEFMHCGGSCGSEKEYYTFDKKDGWTVRTADGSLSAHFENQILITKNQAEVLTCLNNQKTP